MSRWQAARRVSTRLQASHVKKQEPSIPYRLGRSPLRTFVTVHRDEAPPASYEKLSPDHDLYLSTSTDPYFNLTLEDWLFRHARASEPLLLIYRNSPCVVVGRNQNPWTEVNFPALQAARIPFIRRRSGGGTVYHDLGNTNFSIHMPRTAFDRHASGSLILRAVRSLGIDARLNERNDVCIGPDKMSSAYKIVNTRAYHHGTMLITTQLSTLGDFLRPQTQHCWFQEYVSNIVTKGVASVRSPVCNLEKYATDSTHDSFASAVVTEFRKDFGITTDACTVVDNEATRDIKYIRTGIRELSTWDWAYGQTPEFTHTLDNHFPWGKVTVKICSKHGLIFDSSLLVYDGRIRTETIEHISCQLRDLLHGKRYGFLQESVQDRTETGGVKNSALRTEHWHEPLQDLYTWVARTTSIVQ